MSLTRTIPVSPSDWRIAQYAAGAIALSVVEAALPSPIPGVKPGLANIIVLLVLLRHGWREAMWVSLLRVGAAGLLFGSLMTPGFFLSFAGAVSSLAALAMTQYLPRHAAGPVTHSVVAAFAHVGGQLLLARLWLLPDDAIFFLLPAFCTAALLFGVINGLIVARLTLALPPAPSAAPPIATTTNTLSTRGESCQAPSP